MTSIRVSLTIVCALMLSLAFALPSLQVGSGNPAHHRPARVPNSVPASKGAWPTVNATVASRLVSFESG